MGHSVKLLALAVLAFLVTAGHAQNPKRIFWKPEARSTHTTELSFEMKFDGSAGLSEATAVFHRKATIKSVTKDQIVVEYVQIPIEVVADGTDVTGVIPEVSSTVTYAPSGKVLSVESQESDTDSYTTFALAFIYPASQMEHGGSWTSKTDQDDEFGVPSMTKVFTFQHTADLEHWKTLVVDAEYSEEGGNSMSYEGRFWIETEGAGIVKAEYDIKNLALGPGMFAETVKWKERRLKSD